MVDRLHGTRRSQAAWVVRANPHHKMRIDEFKKDGIVALGWPAIGNLAGMDLKGIRSLLRRGDPSKFSDPRELANNAGPLDSFVNRVSEGDFVVTPSPVNGSVYIGQFVGDYIYAKEKKSEGYPHQRRVHWLLSRERGQLPASVYRSLRAQQPIFSTDSAAVRKIVRQSRSRTDSTINQSDDDATPFQPPAFRRNLLRRYGAKCMISGSTVDEVIDAAHITPYRGESDHHEGNGVLLRTDLHALYDLGLLGIEPVTLKIRLHPSLRKSEYAEFHRRRLRCDHAVPAESAIKRSWEIFQRLLRNNAVGEAF